MKSASEAQCVWPKELSEGEETFAIQCRAKFLNPEREYKFFPGRNWRFDFAFPFIKLAIEVEGGVWKRGRHNRPKGMIADMEKYNKAMQMGWTVFRYPTAKVISGQAINEVVRYIEEI